jgi:toxin ParE1/3/4
MKLRFTPEAQSDIEKIYAYISQRSPSGARNVSVAIYGASRFVADRPKASPLTDIPNVRVKVLRRYQYKIFYRVAGDTVEILHVQTPVGRRSTGLVTSRTHPQRPDASHNRLPPGFSPPAYGGMQSPHVPSRRAAQAEEGRPCLPD